MHASHGSFVELEVGDWRDNRKYRILAFEAGKYAFSECKFRQWPVIIVTEPSVCHRSCLIPA
jgi:hypothetical protein